jgi:hypothetical protein
MIDNGTAERLREVLFDLQVAILAEDRVPTMSQWKLVTIARKGLRLVDELEGVNRPPA